MSCCWPRGWGVVSESLAGSISSAKSTTTGGFCAVSAAVFRRPASLACFVPVEIYDFAHCSNVCVRCLFRRLFKAPFQPRLKQRGRGAQTRRGQRIREKGGLSKVRKLFYAVIGPRRPVDRCRDRPWPCFVDLNQYKGEIAAELEAATGRESDPGRRYPRNVLGRP